MRLEKWPTINRPILQLDKASATSDRRVQRKVRSFWSNGFSASLLLADPCNFLRPGRKLQGKVIIHSKALVTFVGLRVQLDAQCTLFLEKGGELVTKRFSILQTAFPGDVGTSNNAQQSQNINYSARKVSFNPGSGIYCDAVESLQNSKEIYALIPDLNSVVDALTFPFSLEIPGGQSFPCPFNNTLGTLVYKLSAHLCSQDLRYAQIAEETLEFKGYSNLSNNSVETGRIISIERPSPPLVSSFSSLTSSSSSTCHAVGFGGYKEISCRFRVESSGFLPEEAVHFMLFLRNPKKMTIHMKVFIIQKVTHSIAENCWKKVTSTVVRSERAEVGGATGSIPDNGEIFWRGALIIPKGQIPSFYSANAHPGYSVSYSVQFKVEGLDRDWSLKGSAPLYIGTCRNYYGDGRGVARRVVSNTITG